MSALRPARGRRRRKRPVPPTHTVATRASWKGPCPLACVFPGDELHITWRWPAADGTQRTAEVELPCDRHETIWQRIARAEPPWESTP